MIPTQTFIKENVVEAARRRVSFVFDHFETIHVSVSGGKDSTVLAYLVLEEARRRGASSRNTRVTSCATVRWRVAPVATRWIGRRRINT